MTSLHDVGEKLPPQKAPAIDRERFMAGLATDLHAGCQSGTLTALILVDIFRLRHINNRFGYETGDSVLAWVYEALCAGVKKASVIRRLDGNVFGISVPEMKSPRLLPVAAGKIQQLLNRPISCHEDEIRLDCSVSITVGPDYGHTEHRLLLHAEQCLERAKQDGSRCYVVEALDEENRIGEWELRDELNKAVGSGELKLYYQPKISLANFMPTACEALMRWDSEKLGRVGPDQFIPVAERTGQILDLSEWAILTLPREARHIRYRNQALNVALNLSPRDLSAGHLQSTLESALNIWEMPREKLTLEITESTLMDNPQQSQELMQNLRNRGYRLSIDDFGTGYSSMSYFKLIPAHEIKIDKYFIQNLVHDRGDQIIVKAVIAIAHHFNMKTVAEGVEDEATLKLLMKMKCDYAQGYYFSRPLVGEEFQQWLEGYSMARYFSPQEKQLARRKAAND